ncbi:MAG: hypothetical protein PUA83_05340 [Clostridiales bacterium]|nr:hypothetical protein [Clostridiales bacterium]
MRKKILLFTILFVCLLSFSCCQHSNKNEEALASQIVSISDTDIHRYLFEDYAIEFSAPSENIISDMVLSELEKCTYFSEISSKRKSCCGDTVIIDYIVSNNERKVVSICNDVVINLTEESYSDSFASNLLGLEIGETVTFSYSSDEFGKFEDYFIEATMLSIGHFCLPELTDEFVNERYGAENVKDFKSQLARDYEETYIEQEKDRQFKQRILYLCSISEYFVSEEDIEDLCDELFLHCQVTAEYLEISVLDYAKSVYLPYHQKDTLSPEDFADYASNEIKIRLTIAFLGEKWGIEPDQDIIETLVGSGVSYDDAEYMLIETAVKATVFNSSKVIIK